MNAQSYKIFTLRHGKVSEGAEVKNFNLSGGASIPAILIGEDGRGRKLGVLPVHVPLIDNGEYPRLMAASVGQTKTGNPKLFPAEETTTDEVLVVVSTEPGFRGSCSQGGEQLGYSCPRSWRDPNPEILSEPPASGDYSPRFEPLPGQVLCTGETAQGIAGNMGGGSQLVALLPRDKVLSEHRTGRLYGAPSVHFYKWTGEHLLAATRKEREVSDIF